MSVSRDGIRALVYGTGPQDEFELTDPESEIVTDNVRNEPRFTIISAGGKARRFVDRYGLTPLRWSRDGSRFLAFSRVKDSLVAVDP